MAKDWGVLKIDERHMWVSLSLNKPEAEEEVTLSADFVVQYLRDNGIVAGIKEEAIEALVEQAPYGKEIIVAEGKQAENGMDGIYKYLVPLEDTKSKPVVNKDGTVDYANSLKLAMVEEGDVLAVYVPPTEGVPGWTVLNEEIKPVPGKEPRPLNGKGIVYNKEKKEYTAEFSGRIYKDNKRIIVEKIYVLNGELDLEHGNIEFNGDVEIRGDVRSGLRIVTEGSIFIHGHVGNCKLKAGGNITIEKGVQGKNGCEIYAGGDVAGSFLESCTVRAEGNVYANSMLNCKVYARKNVVVMSKAGHIIGGVVIGIQGVKARTVGNEAFITTRIHFRELAEYEKQLVQYIEEIKKLDGDIGLLDKQLKVFDNIDGSKRTKETEMLRMKIVRAKVVCTSRQRELEESCRILKDEISTAKKESVVVISEAVYPGVIVGVQGATFQVQEAFKEVTFKYKNGQVLMGTLEE